MADDFSCCLNWAGTATITTPQTVGDPVSVSCHTADWQLWEPGVVKLTATPKLRGQNRLIPLMDGRRQTRRRIDERTVELPMAFLGQDADDPYRVMLAARDEFYAANVAPIDLAAVGSRTVDVESKDATETRTGDVVVDGLEEAADPEGGPGWVMQDYTLTITIVGGYLQLVP